MEFAVERVIDKGDGPVTHQALATIIETPAPELPEQAADVSGVFVDLTGDVLRVGTGNIEADVDIHVISGQEPVEQVTLTHDGPDVDVLLTSDTAIYRDETGLSMHDIQDLLPEGTDASIDLEMTIQQLVALVDSREEIGESTELQVWTRKVGDDLVADVVVYRIVSEL